MPSWQAIGKVERLTCLASLLSWLVSPPASAKPPFHEQLIDYPPGAYALWPSDRELSDGIRANYGLRGVIIQAKWEDVEPRDDDFYFDDVRDRIREASQAGLSVVLGINGAVKRTPVWLTPTETISLLNGNVYQEDYCEEITGPTFWDRRFLKERMELIQAMAVAFTDDPSIVAVETNFANYLTDDWNVPHATAFTCEKDGEIRTENQVEEWLDAGYTHEKMMEAGKTVLEMVARAFPKHVIKLPLGTTHDLLDGQEYRLAREITEWVETALPGRVYIEVHSLNLNRESFQDLPEETAYYDAIYKLIGDAAPQSGLQLVASATYVCNTCRLSGGTCPEDCPDPSVSVEVLQQVMDIGLSYGPSYIEVWAVDGENDALFEVIDNTSFTLEWRTE
jgi:hypothetical protein